MSLLPDLTLIKTGWRGVCPRCAKFSIYETRWTMNVRDVCPSCGLKLSENDSGDGPAVFLIFILGFLLVPLALVLEFAVAPPLWVHAVLWGAAALGLTLGSLRPLKAYIIALQYRYRPDDF